VPPGLIAQGTKEEAAKEEGPAFRPEEIDQINWRQLRFILITYWHRSLRGIDVPLEIVQAGRFVQQNKDLKGEKLMAAAKDKDWDPSVKAMLEFSRCLAMMNDKLEWTEKLGNAFLSQQRTSWLQSNASDRRHRIWKSQDHKRNRRSLSRKRRK